MPDTCHIVVASKGEYSDRTEWPVAVYLDETLAQARVLHEAEKDRRERAEMAERWRRYEARLKAEDLPGWSSEPAVLERIEAIAAEMGDPEDPDWSDEVHYTIEKAPFHG